MNSTFRALFILGALAAPLTMPVAFAADNPIMADHSLRSKANSWE